jgi:hypothetical protein
VAQFDEFWTAQEFLVDHDASTIMSLHSRSEPGLRAVRRQADGTFGA